MALPGVQPTRAQALTAQSALAADVARRDSGLARAIGPLGMGVITLNILMGAGFYVVPGEMARLGPLAPLGMISCAFAVGAVLLCLAEGASRAPTSGGIYGIVEAAFGRPAGIVAGGLTWIMVTFAGAAVLAASADQAARLLPALVATVPRSLYIAAACTAFAALASRSGGPS